MTLTVFGPSRSLPLAAPLHNSAKYDKGRTHAERWLTVGPSDPSLGQRGGPKGWCSAQPSHGTTTPASNLWKKAGEPTPLRGQKGVSNTPEPSQPLDRETKGIRRWEEVSTQPGRSSTSRRRGTGRPLGIRRRRLGEASEIIGSVFPREKLSAPPFCRTFPMTLILNPLPSSRNGQSPALASTSASFSHHPAVRLQSGQHQPVTEIWARPTPSHLTPRSLRRPISAVAGARRSLITWPWLGWAVGGRGRQLAGGGLCIPVASAAKWGARRRVSQVESHLFWLLPIITSYSSSASCFSFGTCSAKSHWLKKTPEIGLDGPRPPRERGVGLTVEIGAPGHEPALKSAGSAVIQPATEPVNYTA